MLEVFLFVGLPYLSFFVLVFGSIYRFRKDPFSYSARSSQFLENQRLHWGSLPWHLGILIILIGHLLPVFFPSLWHVLTTNQSFLIAVETIGAMAAVLCLVGLAVLFVRRTVSAKLQPATSVMDLVVEGLLLAQIAIGLGIAVQYRWGASWSTGTTTPYLWSLLTLRPDTSYIAQMPALIRLHLVLAWILFLLVPFSRLVHMFSIPLGYITRPPQKVVWTTARRLEQTPVLIKTAEARRHFLRGALGTAGALVLLSVGVLDKFVRFFQGPRMSPDEEAELLEKRLERLRLAAEQRELQLERMRSPYIYIARLSDLSAERGQYFIDYEMRPALAFLDPISGLPLLISAKCTHLGCTVGSEADEQGRILCPCHVSYFDIQTGQPNPGSPAEQPLPHLGWVLMDEEGNRVAAGPSESQPEGQVDLAESRSYMVFHPKEMGGPA